MAVFLTASALTPASQHHAPEHARRLPPTAMRREDRAIAAASLLLLAYTIFRASSGAFNPDESFSYVYHVRASLRDIIGYNIRLAPSNNHLLNTLLMKVSAAILGPSELALRLPNLGAHAVYLVSSALVARRLRNSVGVLSGFMILNLNPFVLDYFSLARGYGLGLAFTMSSLHFALRCFEGTVVSTLHLSLSLLFAMLAVLSNFTFLNFYLALFVVLAVLATLRLLHENRPGSGAAMLRKWALTYAPFLVGSLLGAAIVNGPIRKLRRMKEFYVGGTEGFWQDTVRSVVEESLYGQSYSTELTPLISATVGTLAGVSVVLFIFVAGKRRSSDPPVALLLLVFPVLAISALSTILQHVLLNVNFLAGRTAILFIPLLSLLFISAVYWGFAWSGPAGETIRSIVLAAGAAAFAVHLVGSARVEHPEWDVIPRVLRDVEKDYRVSASKSNRVSLGVPRLHEPTVNFYRITWKLTWLKRVTRGPLTADYDYYFTAVGDEALIGKRLVRIREYDDLGHFLAKRVSQ